MKKNSILAIFLALSFLFILPHISQAQSTTDPAMPEKAMEILPYPGNQGRLFMGHEHAYTVTLRGNGEAHVVLKAAFTNSENATSSAVLFKLTKVIPNDLVAYQVVREGQCIAYKTTTVTNDNFSVPVCEKFADPNYFEPYYYGTVQYKKTTAKVQDNQIEVTLPQSIDPEKSGSVILFYTASGYTTKTISGGYDFNFETLKVDEPIRSLQVGINTDTNYKIKGISSEVQYRDVFTPSVAMQEFSKGYSSDSTMQYLGQIGSGRLVKNAYELQPNETYIVTGTYGRSWWSLYAIEVIIGIAIVLFAGGLIIFLLRKLYVRIVNLVKHESNEDTLPKSKQNILFLLGLSFVSSFLIGGYSAFQFFIISLIQRQYYDSTITLFVGLVLFIISLLIYGFLFVGPPLFVGLKRGTMWGIGTFVAILCWLFMYVMIFLLLAVYLRTLFSNSFNPMPTTRPVIEGLREMNSSVVEDTIAK